MAPLLGTRALRRATGALATGRRWAGPDEDTQHPLCSRAAMAGCPGDKGRQATAGHVRLLHSPSDVLLPGGLPESGRGVVPVGHIHPALGLARPAGCWGAAS